MKSWKINFNFKGIIWSLKKKKLLMIISNKLTNETEFKLQ